MSSLQYVKKQEDLLMYNIKKNFGFGCMRLPMIDGEVDQRQFSEMVDPFLEAGLTILIRHTGIWEAKANWH